MDWLSVLSNNSEAVSAVAALLSAITTIGLAVLYYLQHQELIRQREITSWSTAPRLTVLSIVVTSENEIEYVLKNQGERIAADISYTLSWTPKYETSLDGLLARLRYASKTRHRPAYNRERTHESGSKFVDFVEAHDENEFGQSVDFMVRDRVKQETATLTLEQLLDRLPIQHIKEITFEIYVEYDVSPYDTDKVYLIPPEPMDPERLCTDDGNKAALGILYKHSIPLLIGRPLVDRAPDHPKDD